MNIFTGILNSPMLLAALWKPFPSSHISDHLVSARCT